MPTSFIEYLVIILVILAIGGKELAFSIAKKFGFTNGVEKKVDVLTQHYNHDITEKLDKLTEKMDKIINQNTEIITLLRNK